jgi:hypothetical protein
MLTHDDLPGVDIHLVKVDSETARTWLKQNMPNQRTLSETTYEGYASDMVTGDWMFAGDPIRFDNRNFLIDGQHRLTAIAESGEAQVLLVIRGLDPDVVAAIDGGRKRSYADIIKMRDIKNHTAVASIVNRSWHWYHGCYGKRNVARVALTPFLASSPSNAQKDAIKELIEAKFEITFEQAAQRALNYYALRPGITVATYGLFWVILSGIDKDLREKFFHELTVEPEFPQMGYPIMALINRLSRVEKGDLDSVDQLDALCRVYNAWLKDAKMETVKAPRPVRWSVVAIPEGFKEVVKW